MKFRFYLHSLKSNVVFVTARGKVGNTLMHMQKSREALADARKSIRKRVENKQ